MPKTGLNEPFTTAASRDAYRHMHLTTLVQQAFRKAIALTMELDCQAGIEGKVFCVYALAIPRLFAAECHPLGPLPLLLVCMKSYISCLACSLYWVRRTAGL